jgi:hypothetical protein
LLLYVSAAAANGHEVQRFVQRALQPAAESISPSVFLELDAKESQQAALKFGEQRVGSIYSGDQLDGLTAGEILSGRVVPRPQ